MSFRARLIHDLAIVTPTVGVEDDVDEYGQPVEGEPDVDFVSGLIQPKSTREVALISQAGAALSDHTIFLALTATVETRSYVRFEPDTGERFEVTGIRTFDFGRSPHLEVDARRIVSEALVTS